MIEPTCVNRVLRAVIVLLCFGVGSGVSAETIGFDEFLAIAGEDIAREYASCSGFYALWAGQVESEGNAENARQLQDAARYSLDSAAEAVKDARTEEAANDFVRGNMLDTVKQIRAILERTGEWSSVFDIYLEPCTLAVENPEQAVQRLTQLTGQRLRDQGIEVAAPRPPAEQPPEQ